MISTRRLTALIGLTIPAFFFWDSTHYYLCLVLFISGITYPRTLRPFIQFKFWIPILILLILVPLFTGNRDSAILGIPFSSDRLMQSVFMTMRGIILYLVFAVLTTDIDSDKMKGLFKKLRLPVLVQMVTIGEEIFPRVKSIFSARQHELKTIWNYFHPMKFVPFAATILADFTRLTNELMVKESPTISPAQLLQSLSGESNTTLTIINGVAGSGKTPWVESLKALLQNEGQLVDGFISVKENMDKHHWHHNLMRIKTGEQRKMTTMDYNGNAKRVGKFFFLEGAFNWANSQLEDICDATWVILDEVGPLELEEKGLFPVMECIANHSPRHIVMTMRPSVTNQFMDFISRHFPDLLLRKVHTIDQFAYKPKLHI